MALWSRNTTVRSGIRGLGLAFAVILAATDGRPAAQTPPLREVWLHQPDASTLVRVTTAFDPARTSGSASISGDGRLIAFQSRSEFDGQKVPDKTSEIWLYDVAAKRFTRVTTSPDPGRISMNPAISADGSTIVFDSDADLLKEGLPRDQQEIWSYSVASGQTRRLTRGGARAISDRPATNADGSVVAFQSNVAFDGDGTAGRSREMWVLTPASSTPVRVTRSEPGRRSERPALDAAGHTLVFESDASLAGHRVPPGQLEIWMYDVRGKALKRITDAADPSRVSQAPSISADGRRVVFQSQADLGKAGHPDSVDEIWLYDTAKDALEKLTTTWVASRDAGTNAPRHPDSQGARITADGGRVVFASDADFLGEKKVVNGYPHVWILDLASRKLQRIDTAAGSGSGIAISADASRVALFRSSFDDFRLANVTTTAGIARPDKLSAEQARTDLDAFEKELTGRWAYLKANGVDLRAAVSRLREKAVAGIDTNDYGLELQKIIAKFIDGHSGVSGYTRTPGSLPFFIEQTNGRFLAIKPDRTAFYDPTLPYITRIDGRAIEEWLKLAAPFYPQGSPQYKQWRALGLLRSLAFLRQQAGAPASSTARVELVNEDRASRREVEVAVGASGGSAGGAWPHTQQTGLIDGNVGYLRITSMGPRDAEDVVTWMPKFRDTRGLIVDVRGNGGGLRDPLRALFPYLMSESDAPRVVNAAKYRLHPEYRDDHLGGSRFMYVESSAEWTPAERAAIVAFKKTFKPEWTPPAAEFSGWHYLVMSRKTNPQAFVYGKPVIVLLDEKCFSATDVFLSALKGWHDVTLMGYASGGGSARQVGVTLPISRMSFSLASMASFQWTGRLYDTRGIHPDIVVHPGPTYFLTGGKDNILEEALKRLK
jgi:Tol biopolymer transport system component